MQNTEEWWRQTFQMHTQLMENFDAGLLQEFRQRLDSLPPYTYAMPREGLGIGLLMQNKLPIALKWSNLYAVEMIACKLTSMEVMKNEVNSLTKEQQQVCIAEVERNR